jgi:hypothetical protein
LKTADSASDFLMLTGPTSTRCLRFWHSSTCSDDRVFFARRAVDLVIVVVANTGLVGRDRRACRCHAGEIRIQPEVILKCDRGERLVPVLDGYL